MMGNLALGHLQDIGRPLGVRFVEFKRNAVGEWVAVVEDPETWKLVLVDTWTENQMHAKAEVIAQLLDLFRTGDIR